MGLIGLAAEGAHKVAMALANLEKPHGPWCEKSKGWMTPPDEFIVPIRVGEEYLDKMLTPDGWEANVGAIFLRPVGDRTYNLIFREAEEIDHSMNRAFQRMIMAGLDLAEALDVGNDDLSEEAITALAEFRKAARSRMLKDLT